VGILAASMTFSPEILTLLVLLSLGLTVLALFLLTSVTARIRRPDPTALSPGERAEAILEEHASAIGELRATVERLGQTDAGIGKLLERAVQRVGLVRFDAFEDMGGGLSFSVALLDAGGDGVVVTSINGRQDTRVYAKPVSGGVSNHNLSDEEAEAISQAMAGPADRIISA
jgi:hypothetical protein